MKKVGMDELMALHDSELSAAAARDVAERVAAQPEAQAQLAALAELGELTRDHYQRATAETDAQLASAWARLESRLEPVPAPARSAVAAPAASWFARLVDALKPKLGYALVGALGVAAGAFLVARFGRSPMQIVHIPDPAAAVAMARSLPPTMVASLPEATDVGDIDAPGGAPLVFDVPSDDPARRPPTTMILVNDDDAEGAI